jgi:hypothetical protein
MVQRSFIVVCKTGTVVHFMKRSQNLAMLGSCLLFFPCYSSHSWMPCLKCSLLHGVTGNEDDTTEKCIDNVFSWFSTLILHFTCEICSQGAL